MEDLGIIWCPTLGEQSGNFVGLCFVDVSDEPQLERLQTGVYYTDDTPKASLEHVAGAARSAERGRIDC